MCIDVSKSSQLSAIREAIAAGAAGRCGFFFDFDGTIADIQDDPDTVEPVSGAICVLTALREAGARVTIISARPVDYLQRKFGGIGGVRLFGLYGLQEGLPHGGAQFHPTAEPFLAVMTAIAARARTQLPPAAAVEYKHVAVALHYRADPTLRTTLLEFAQAEALAHGLTVQAGRMVFELRPPGGRDKGTVVLEQSVGLTFAAYFGDDLGDEPAFDALDGLAERGANFVAMRVAVANPETGAEIARRADVVLALPRDVPVFVRMVLDQVRPDAHTPVEHAGAADPTQRVRPGTCRRQ